jgi:tetratricopeptide (TPR) repeat protein
MHLELDPHPHPHPAVGSRRSILPWLLIAAVVGLSAYLALRGDGKSGATGAGDQELAARFREGVSILERYDYLTAYKVFAEVAAARPNWAAAHFNAGLAALNLQEDKDHNINYFPIAEAEFRETLKLDPGNLPARFCLALLNRFLQRNLDEALDLLQAVARADPTDPHALYEYGATLAERKRYPEAKAVLEEVVKIQPAFGPAVYKLGNEVYRVLKEDDKRAESLKRFQDLRNIKAEIITGLKYGEAGKYASAIRSPFPSAARPAASSAGPGPSSGEAIGVGAAPAARVRPDGRPAPPAFCVGDLDGDGIPDLVLCGQPGAGSSRAELWKGEGSGTTFKKVADLAADGDSAALGDLDGDGDLDLVLAGDGSILALDNDGKGGFTPSNLKLPPAAKGFPLKVVVFDADADWDLDILVLRQLSKEEKCETSVELLNSNRDGTFEDIAGKVGIARLPLEAEDAVVADLDGDIDIDILVLGKSRDDSVVLLNDRAWRYRRVAARELGGAASLLARAGLAPSVEAALADSRPVAESMIQGADASGKPILFRARPGGPLALVPAGPAPRTWIGIDLAGKKDPKPGQEWANPFGVGATVEVVYGERSQVCQVNCAGEGGAWGPPRLVFDLDGADKIDFVRILWPDGVLQSERALPAGRFHRIEEIQRKPTSCPILFAWNGTRFEYAGNFLGVGGLGYLEAPGTYAKPDPTELIELPALQPARGPGEVEELQLSVMEALEECTYLDSVALFAVDAPEGLTVHPDEIFPVRAPDPAARLFAFEKALLPVRATDDAGRDVTEALRSVDRVYAGARRLDRRFPGAAEPHSVVLEWAEDLPRMASERTEGGPRPVLYLYGTVEFGYSTSNFAAAQARVGFHAPTISVERGGRWVPLRTEWGFPDGTPKWMTVDLGGTLRDGDRRLRIESDMEIYWDQAFVALSAPIPLGAPAGPSRSFTVRDVSVQVLAPDRAELRFRGFPRESSPDGREPKIPDYQDVSPTGSVKPFPGRYTRYGEVADLIDRRDDRFAVFGAGDEVLIAFRADRLAPPARGMKRTFFLGAVGYCKDMDLYTAASDRVEPLPFASMSAYPPPAGESPRGDAEDALRNDRVVEPLVLKPRP